MSIINYYTCSYDNNNYARIFWFTFKGGICHDDEASSAQKSARINRRTHVFTFIVTDSLCIYFNVCLIFIAVYGYKNILTVNRIL